ncbi:hypothetical protein ACHMZP_32860 [Rhodococcus baikonurensis]|uniref:hypothetical protein n=1 Tax=Rhodococcus baikonurensis TaxID=172041 RepID=UPI0037BDFF11
MGAIGKTGRMVFIAELTYPVLLDEFGPPYLEGAYGQSAFAAESPAAAGMGDLLIEEFGEEEGSAIAQQPTAALAYDPVVSGLLARQPVMRPRVQRNLHAVTDSGGTPVYSLDEGLDLLVKDEKLDYQSTSGAVVEWTPKVGHRI